MLALNEHCFCTGLDDAGLSQALQSPALDALVRERCPHAFAARPVFVPGHQLDRMAAVVQAVERVVALPAVAQAALARAPAIAGQLPLGPRGVFFGHDFHVNGDQIGLIEINTNAGGAMLNAVAARAQRGCCEPVLRALPGLAAAGELADALERDIVAMFQQEWALAGRTRPLRSIAIVDEAPAQQYLYPEFLLFQRLFSQHGLQAVVCDPSELQWRDGSLWAGELAVDLVYNRLTDFYLAGEPCRALREAALADGVLLTPHPRAHALVADKRQLMLLSDTAQLQALGVDEADRALLAEAVPRTLAVTPERAAELWATRKQWFFKPATGFGSRAAYRGDKLTRRVWDEIVAGGDHVAQALVPPGERVVDGPAGGQALKYDLRLYTYAGQVQWVAARLYQGQTTNFRTPGGGFAPVYRVALPAEPQG
jgi:hypothetical protein